MNQAETEFLALMAIGVFSIDEQGAIWRHKEWTKGSRTGSAPALLPLKKRRRADVSSSGKRHARSTTYRRVMFIAKGNRWSVHAHRVVWMVANNDVIPQGLEINHKDGNGQHNSPANLEVVTTSQNVTHSIRVLGATRKARQGTDNAQAKLTEAQVAQIRHLASLKSMPQRKIGEMFGVDQQTVSNIHRGKTWKHILTG